MIMLLLLTLKYCPLRYTNLNPTVH
jgi:hypothetical protein